MSAWLVIFCLICVAAADECSKTCEKNTGEGCDGRWKVGGEVVMCAERSRYQILCAVVLNIMIISQVWSEVYNKL